ncbi:SWIB domain-containing protein [Cynara cardunculus var. scolymus]|uniref:SWIB domain-containing protein n=1 Tax=Cynara cardunculus var. scolymus TaxID=59895 RepID=A0A103Y3M8_CYNCS|nr:SWIB domain-containing protein [Cynara cardunculus var. scolymus]
MASASKSIRSATVMQRFSRIKTQWGLSALLIAVANTTFGGGYRRPLSIHLHNHKFHHHRLPTTSLSIIITSFRIARTFVTYATVSKPATEPKKRVNGFTKTYRVSPELKDFLGGVPEVSRSLALKEIWAYIKEKELQEPTNKKVIVCDEKLKTIFGGKNRVKFLEISGLISPHLLK